MPAIQLARITDEIDFLAKRFDRPEEFLHTLKELYERYANWSFRPGEHAPKNTQAPQYYIPPIIPQRLVLALKPQVERNPQQAIELALLLWQDPYFEVRQLAVSLLGVVQVQSPDDLIDQMKRFIKPGDDPYILNLLFEEGFGALRRSAPQTWLLLLEGWIQSSEVDLRLIGIRALIASVKDLDFPYLPNLYKLATEQFLKVHASMMALMQNLVEAFIQRSPSETSFLFKQILLRNPPHETIRLIRRNLGLFPKELQLSIRSVLSNLRSNHLYE